MTFKFSAASCVLALVLAACGGGTGGTSNPSVTGTPAPVGPTPTPTSVGTTPTVAPTPTGTIGSLFITATVDGSVRSGTVDVTGSWVDGVGPGSGLTAKTTDSPAPAVWSIQHLKNEVGTYNCSGGTNSIAISFQDPTVVVNPMTDGLKIQVTSVGAPGTCSLTVTAASATVIEGNFTATLHNSLGYTRTVTNGSFKVQNNTQF